MIVNKYGSRRGHAAPATGTACATLMTRCRITTALLLLFGTGGADASGSEMSGLALAVPVLIVIGLVILLAFAALAYALLPVRWPKATRWVVAVAAAPGMLAVLVLVVSGPGLLQMALSKLLL